MKLVRNEGLKLSAASLNGIAIALVAVGAIAPFVDTSAAAAVARLEHVIRPFSCWLASAALHLLARLLLRELKE